MTYTHGKCAVITGAGSGIGRALALRLNSEGCALYISDINPDTLAETVGKLQRADIPCDQQVLDVAAGKISATQLTLDPLSVFTAQTIKIDELKHVEDRIGEDLKAIAIKQHEDAVALLWLTKLAMNDTVDSIFANFRLSSLRLTTFRLWSCWMWTETSSGGMAFRTRSARSSQHCTMNRTRSLSQSQNRFLSKSKR